CSFRRKCFPAAPSPARAKLTVQIDTHMAETAEAATRSDMQFTVDYQTCAEAFDDENKQQRANLCLGYRAVPKLGKCCCIRVVLDEDRQPETFAKNRSQRHVFPFQVRRYLDRSCFAVDQSRDAHADRAKTGLRILSFENVF